jgi:hypothetical protein
MNEKHIIYNYSQKPDLYDYEKNPFIQASVSIYSIVSYLKNAATSYILY